MSYERLDAHSVRVRGSSPPGYVVVAAGYHEDWQVSGPTTTLLRANGRYMALVAPGGPAEWVLRYRPRWLAPALGLSGLGLLGLGWLICRVPRAPNAPTGTS